MVDASKAGAAAATAAAAYGTVAPALGLPTIAALTGSLTAVAAAAVPAGPILVAVYLGTKAIVQGIKGQWAAQDRCTETAWDYAVDMALESGGAPLLIGDIPSASWADCYTVKKEERVNGEKVFKPAGNIYNITTREPVVSRSRFDILTAEILPQDPHHATDVDSTWVSIFPWFGPYAYCNKYGDLQRVPGEAANAACCAIAAKALERPSRRIYEVAANLTRLIGPSMAKDEWEFMQSIQRTYEEQNPEQKPAAPEKGQGGTGPAGPARPGARKAIAGRKSRSSSAGLVIVGAGALAAAGALAWRFR